MSLSLQTHECPSLTRDTDGVLDEIESKLKSTDFDCIDFKQQQHVKELVQLLDQLGL